MLVSLVINHFATEFNYKARKFSYLRDKHVTIKEAISYVCVDDVLKMISRFSHDDNIRHLHSANRC